MVREPRLWPLFRPAIRAQFDRLAADWDAGRSPDSLAPYEAALTRVEGHVSRALDVGTGTGAGAIALARRFPAAVVVGIDVAPAMVAEAERLLPEALAGRVTFGEADAADLPFDAASFDLVAHANMIPFLDEVRRVLRAGGWATFAFSSGAETPIYVEAQVLRRALERRGFTQFAEIAAGRGTAVVARRV